MGSPESYGHHRKATTLGRVGPGRDIKSFLIRPQLKTASDAQGSMPWLGTAASCSHILRHVHPQHALASIGAYLEPMEQSTSALPEGQATHLSPSVRPHWCL
eukprot:3849786-Amphidinium_carterae.1